MMVPAWIIPLLLTVVAFVAAGAMSRDDTYGLARLFCFGGAAILVLAVWLIYAIAT